VAIMLIPEAVQSRRVLPQPPRHAQFSLLGMGAYKIVKLTLLRLSWEELSN
jgi:hypothetical protein